MLWQLLQNMGLRYVAFRIWYLLQMKTGLLKIRFPKYVNQSKFGSLAEWRNSSAIFFQKDDQHLRELFHSHNFETLRGRVLNIHATKFQFFSSATFTMNDWHTNPETGYKYNKNQHWSKITDFSTEAGDIKYVWEKSRFSFLYDLIRYDFHFQQDQSRLVFVQIQSWINSNPVNSGPNWKCSQEITLRVLNWTFALQYYKNSPNLTEATFDQITNSIHQQMQHVESNINFSRIAVRNNHAMTETLGLYLTGLLYPFFPSSARWKEKGRKWFEEEIAYQIYADGTFLQFSMNYHRVVVQLLTWAIFLAESNGERWSNTVYDRARKSVYFLRSCQDNKTGWLPNYGNNDGALFFPLTESHFRDFRPQLAALANLLEMDLDYESGLWEEEMLWFQAEDKVQRTEHGKESDLQCPRTFTFSQGGYHILRDTDTISFLRCGGYKDRPFQSDNLHLDIWVDGENILHDSGSYKYNTEERWTRYFMGTAGHNTVMLGDHDQMQKRKGFIWNNWVEKANGKWGTEEGGKFAVFDGEFEGFRSLGKGIKHRRKVKKMIGQLSWVIEDWIENAPEEIIMNQLWHLSDIFFERYKIEAFDDAGDKITASESLGWYSDFYGQKQESRQITFSSNKRYIKTIVEIRRAETYLKNFRLNE